MQSLKEVVTFSDSAKKQILSYFNKDVDAEGYIIEKNNPAEKVLSPNGQEIKIEEFAGIMGGSEIFLKSDLISIIELSDRLK